MEWVKWASFCSCQHGQRPAWNKRHPCEACPQAAPQAHHRGTRLSQRGSVWHPPLGASQSTLWKCRGHFQQDIHCQPLPADVPQWPLEPPTSPLTKSQAPQKALLDDCDAHLKSVVEALGATQVIGGADLQKAVPRKPWKEWTFTSQLAGTPHRHPPRKQNGGADWRANVRSVLP